MAISKREQRKVDKEYGRVTTKSGSGFLHTHSIEKNYVLIKKGFTGNIHVLNSGFHISTPFTVETIKLYIGNQEKNYVPIVCECSGKVEVKVDMALNFCISDPEKYILGKNVEEQIQTKIEVLMRNYVSGFLYNDVNTTLLNGVNNENEFVNAFSDIEEKYGVHINELKIQHTELVDEKVKSRLAEEQTQEKENKERLSKEKAESHAADIQRKSITETAKKIQSDSLKNGENISFEKAYKLALDIHMMTRTGSEIKNNNVMGIDGLANALSQIASTKSSPVNSAPVIVQVPTPSYTNIKNDTNTKLNSDIYEKAFDFISQGYSKDEALKLAVESFNNSDSTQPEEDEQHKTR